jgi:hypothetical protein
MFYQTEYTNAKNEIVEAIEMAFLEDDYEKTEEEVFQEAEALLEKLFQGARVRRGCPRRSLEEDKVFKENQYKEFKTFMESVNYDAGYGSQEFFGFVLLNNNSWFERHEYDGSECWVLKKRPELTKPI